MRQVGATLHRGAGTALHRGARASHHRGPSRRGAQAPDAQAQQPWLTGPGTPRHVGSSQTRARTRVPCTSRQTLNHCATREAPKVMLLTQISFKGIRFTHLCSRVRKKLFSYKTALLETLPRVGEVGGYLFGSDEECLLVWTSNCYKFRAHRLLS